MVWKVGEPMRVWPVFIDFDPPYLHHLRRRISMLHTPIGTELLVSHLCRRIESVTVHAPVILAPPNAGPEYRASMTTACRSAAVALDAEDLAQAFATAEGSDVLLFVDPRCFPLDEGQIASFVHQFSVGRHIAHHLVAFERSVAGTREHVNIDCQGEVRGIYRYYEPATWPFISGVAASLVPISSHILSLDPMPSSLAKLRQRLTSRGVSSCDLGLEGGCVDLTKEHGLLMAAEHYVEVAAAQARAAGGSSTVLVGDGHAIAASARILGPVVVYPNARIEDNVTIVGPALIGRGAHVAAGAVVAHALLAAESSVPRGQVVRDCAWDNDGRRLGERPHLSYAERLARVSLEPHPQRTTQSLENAPNRWFLPWKRAVEAVLAAVTLVVLSPLLLLIIALVWLESGTPIFYCAEREGRGGRPFMCLKFRTMAVGADRLQYRLKSQDKLDGPHFKLDDDPRLTFFGRILRTTNFDELPQLINVLVGEMSLVGPRPSPFRENQICVPWREARLSVRPGLTGLWQMCRQNRSSGDFHQWIEYDLLYVQNLSPVVDLKILIATVLTLGGKMPVPVSWLVDLPRTTPRPVTPELLGPPLIDPRVPRRSAEHRSADASSRFAS
jgi:lipopolysaccharide/colanic/teichoic acid biosynthesis glycosyltransferase